VSLSLLIFAPIWIAAVITIGILNQRDYFVAKPTFFWSGLAFLGFCSFMASVVVPGSWQQLILPGIIGLVIYLYGLGGWPFKIRRRDAPPRKK